MASRIKKSKGAITIDLEVAIVKEGDFYVAYCPSLELSGYGESEMEAREDFNTCANIFIEETTKKGTLEKVLLSLGWELTREKYQPPKLSYEDLVMFKNSEKIDKQKMAISS